MTICRQLAVDSLNKLDTVTPRLVGIQKMLSLLADDASGGDEHQLTAAQAGSLAVIEDSLAKIIETLQETHSELTKVSLCRDENGS